MKVKIELIKLIDDILENNKYSNIAINELFEKKYFNVKEKAFINNMMNIVLKNKIYIDHIIMLLAKSPKRFARQILRVSIAQILFTEADIAGITYEAVEIAKSKNEFIAKFINSTLRNFNINKEKILENIEMDIKLSYPKWIYLKLKNQFGDKNYLDVLKRYKGKSYFSIRVNHNKISKEEFFEILKSLETEILFNVEDVYYLSNNKILKTKYYVENDIYIQDASSYLAARFLDVSKEDTVLDAASYPGGKSLVILDKYNPKKMVALDIHEHKVKYLQNISKNYSNFKVILADARKFSTGLYDKILLDLPCSGIGVLSKKPEKIYSLKQSDLKEIKKLQKQIFDNCYKLLKKGGNIIYSTCTIFENENTNNVEYFLNKYEDLEVETINFPENIDVFVDKFGGNLITYKNKYLDGFYIVKFRKK